MGLGVMGPLRGWTAALLGLALVPASGCGRAQGAGASAGPGKVLLRADVAGTLVVDGAAAGDLSPGVTRLVGLPPGPHHLALVSAGGEAAWQERLQGKALQVVRVVELADEVARIRQDYVRIPAGSFQMGCVEGDTQCAGDESPPHTVGISRDFWLMRTEVTVGAYAAVAARMRRDMPPAPAFNAGWKWDRYPVVNVTWGEAKDYCASVGARLPTEAEWEYAARGGRAGSRYVWGQEPRPVVAGYKQANVADERGKDRSECQEGPCFAGYDDGYSGTSPSFQYSANGFGLFDMAGNAWEWTADRYGEDYYHASPATDPSGPAAGTAHVARGGSWKAGVAGLRVSNRLAAAPLERDEAMGIRCARDVMAPPTDAGAAAFAPPGTPPSPGGELLVVADAPALLTVDGHAMGELAAGVARPVRLEQGEHLVVVVSRGGEVKQEQTVALGATPVPVRFEVLPTVAAVQRDYVRVPAGTFRMGCVEGDAQCGSPEKPRHSVAVPRDFWMMKTEVTVGAYQALARRTGRAMPPETDTNAGWRKTSDPIANVTWHDAASYCREVGGRLPTEAEWEYAARGGQAAGRYVWGDASTPLVGGRKHANVGDERAKASVGCPQCGWFDGYDDGHAFTAAVGSFEPNGFGLFDMAGNVSEWCADWYRERYYDESPATDPKGSEFGRWRVLRGGSWSMNPASLRTSYRGGFPPDRTTDNYGMRCVRDVALP
jgi:formylglycine-generating enzyme required for sulfatase activity